MFKHLTLGKKIGLGFGALVLTVAVLGLVAWRGVSSISTTVDLTNKGQACLGNLNQCAVLRRDFAAKGFDKSGETDKSADQKWYEAYDALTASLNALKDDKSLTAQ